MRVVVSARTRLFREGLAAQLDAAEGFAVVGIAACGPGCIDAVHREDPDVVLLDAGVADALQTLRVLAAQGVRGRVVALSLPELEEDVLDWLEQGAAGSLTVDQSLAELMATVRSVADGEADVSPRIAAGLVRRLQQLAVRGGPGPPTEPLTARERQIGALLDAGLTNQEIAGELCIELPTVKNHVHNVLTKLHVRRRADVGRRLREIGVPTARQRANRIPLG